MHHDEPLATTDDTWWAPKVRVTCRTCGILRLEATSVGGRHCLDTGTASYHFSCPRCGLRETQPMDPALLPALVEAGAAVTEWRLPAELGERPSGPPISLDDLVDLHHELDGDGWLDRLAGGDRPDPA